MHVKELPRVATKRIGGSRTQVSRPVHLEPGAPRGRPAHGHHKAAAEKKRLAKGGAYAPDGIWATKPDR